MASVNKPPVPRGAGTKTAGKVRLDRLLVERGLAESPERAQALVMAGSVLVDGQVVDKPGTPVPPDAFLALKERSPYVGRGGFKLAAALDAFGLLVSDKVALDVGASTGGFTDCLLQRGATRVYALDVGHGQLDLRLRSDARVVVMERVNARYAFPLPEPVDLATVDVAFISLTRVLPPTAAHLKPEGFVVALVKPQFELRRQEVARGGVVQDPALHAGAVGKVLLWAIDQGLRVRGVTPSPILGDAGNQEFFLLLQKERE
ncbi:MAG: TlyA family RNA methyltransferase [Dehalococcoidia bacterium]|nr:TlyA family RNA methyltransferase [Dehalococcoidia bacterium]